MKSFAVLITLCLAWGARAETRRFALVVGNNAGAGERAPLRYAENDAGKMARVLAELGDVSPEDLLLLQGRPMSEVEAAIVHLREAIAVAHRSPDARAVLLFYFSGHSDGEALELGPNRLSYARLKAMLSGTGAELRVAIIDACRSGSAIMQKGGKPMPGFTIRLADQLAASGEVIITSSAADESALESSEVMGSYFTHNFVSGLRGAADASGDHQITLAEAYRYAYDRTVSETAVAPSGAQHPAYDYRLSGQGELVLASLQRTSATIVLPEGADRALVSDLARDQVIAEVPPGAGRILALAPGSYGVKAIRGGEMFGGRFTLADGGRQVVQWQDLSPLKMSAVAMKGGGEIAGHVEPPAGEGPWIGVFLGGTKGIAQEVSVAGSARISFEPKQESGLVFALHGAYGDAGIGNETALQARVGWRWTMRSEPFFLFAGAEAGPLAIWQTSNGQTNFAASVVIAPRAGVRLHAYGPLWLGLEGELGGTVLTVENQAQFVLLPALNLGAVFAL